MKVAILVDGGFFLKRYFRIYGKDHDAQKIAKEMHKMSLRHIDKRKGERLYRILFYDCRPFEKKAHNPVTNGSIDFSKTKQADFRRSFHEELRRLRKVALRLGHLQDGKGWIIRKDKTKSLLQRKIAISDLEGDDVYYDIRQKGVDMKIGLDIASLALKKMVERIILISGDSDFVPAAKLARREGIDFILDPMWNHVKPGLLEHIDGLKSTSKNPGPSRKKPNPL